MKKIKLLIIIIYITFFVLISGITIFFIVKTVEKGNSLYFQEKQQIVNNPPLQEEDIDRLIDLLRKFKLL